MTATTMRDAVAISRQLIRQNSQSFYLASRLLPRRERDHATVVYAWCRRADDAVDDEGQGDGKRAALARLDHELRDIEGGRGTGDAVVDGFAEVVRQCRIPLLYPRELLRGMEADLGPVCCQTMDELLEYCYRVAGTVGLMMAHVMRVEDDDAITNAAHLGMAMQLTNICRDIVEDWERDRLYLPDELLARHGIARLGQGLGRPLPRSALPGISSAARELLQLADRYYQSGDAGLDRLPWRCSVAVAAARRIYAEIGAVLGERSWDVSAGRAFVSTRRKLHLVGLCLLERTGSLRGRGVGLATTRTRFDRPTRSLAFAEMSRP